MKKDLFRAKLKESGEWVYWDTFGHLCRESGKQQTLVIKTKHGELHYRYVNDIECRIDRNTVCKWIGLSDKKRKRIFTGDIVLLVVLGDDLYTPRRKTVGKVDQQDGSFVIVDDCTVYYRWLYYEEEILGDIFNNPELMEEL